MRRKHFTVGDKTLRTAWVIRTVGTGLTVCGVVVLLQSARGELNLLGRVLLAVVMGSLWVQVASLFRLLKESTRSTSPGLAASISWGPWLGAVIVCAGLGVFALGNGSPSSAAWFGMWVMSLGVEYGIIALCLSALALRPSNLHPFTVTYLIVVAFSTVLPLMCGSIIPRSLLMAGGLHSGLRSVRASATWVMLIFIQVQINIILGAFHGPEPEQDAAHARHSVIRGILRGCGLGTRRPPAQEQSKDD